MRGYSWEPSYEVITYPTLAPSDRELGDFERWTARVEVTQGMTVHTAATFVDATRAAALEAATAWCAADKERRCTHSSQVQRHRVVLPPRPPKPTPLDSPAHPGAGPARRKR